MFQCRFQAVKIILNLHSVISGVCFSPSFKSSLDCRGGGECPGQSFMLLAYNFFSWPNHKRGEGFLYLKLKTKG